MRYLNVVIGFFVKISPTIVIFYLRGSPGLRGNTGYQYVAQAGLNRYLSKSLPLKQACDWVGCFTCLSVSHSEVGIPLVPI